MGHMCHLQCPHLFAQTLTGQKVYKSVKIHTLPVEDFGKVYHGKGVNFQIHIPSVIFRLGLLQRE